MVVLLLSNSLADSVEAVCHNSGHSDEVVCGSEAADGQVSAVLDWLVAAGGRHILRHGGGRDEGVL